MHQNAIKKVKLAKNYFPLIQICKQIYVEREKSLREQKICIFVYTHK